MSDPPPVTKRDVLDRIAVLDVEIQRLNAETQGREDERRMLRELLAEWPDGQETLAALDSEPPDTLPGTPKTKSSQRMAAVKVPPRYPDDPHEEPEKPE